MLRPEEPENPVFTPDLPKDLPLPSLILLKNSIVSGAIPKPKNLEIGEVALTLFEGEEGIWVKNRKGEVKNLRRPEGTLFWDDLFKVYPNRTIFDQALEKGEVNPQALCFIEKEGQIWAKGEFYASSYSPKDLEKIVSQRLIIIPAEVYDLNPYTADSKEIEEAWMGLENFKTVVIGATNKSSLAALKVEGGTIPVSIVAKINSSTDIELRLEWVCEAVYYSETFVYKDGLFGIQKFLRSAFDANAEIDSIKQRLNSVEDNLCWIEAE